LTCRPIPMPFRRARRVL
jgi:hypothetical protein